MDFTSPSFLAFLAILALLYAVVPKAWRTLLLVVASYIFYWLCSGWFVLLLLAATLLAFWAARAKSFLLAVISLLIALLVLVKALPLFQVNWFAPIGISYYTFKLAGYLIDTLWGTIEPEQNLIPFLAFSSFFPQIVGGPIQRAESFLPQAEHPRPVQFSAVMAGLARIMLGFFKKFVVADNLGRIVNYVYAHLTSHPGAPVAFGFYGYPLQMYADFSGLTDIAIGAAAIFGIDSPENFNAPFSAASPSEYWRRWHITLTLWLTDYVFTPLRMSLRSLGSSGLVLSLFVNMILIGLWHGFRWTFALFGVVHATYLAVDALTQKARKKFYKANPVADRFTNWIGPIVTFHLVAVAFVFFRAGSVTSVVDLFTHLFDGIGPFSSDFQELIEAPANSLTILAIAYILMECADYLRRHFWSRELFAGMPRWGRWSFYSCTALTVIFAVLLLLTSSQKGNPFLYAVF